MQKKYQVKTTPTAEDDILSIFKYIAKDKPSAALKWVDEVENQINSLEKYPKRCPVIPEASELGVDYRHIIYGNYRTIFRISQNKVIILRVINASQLLMLI